MDGTDPARSEKEEDVRLQEAKFCLYVASQLVTTCPRQASGIWKAYMPAVRICHKRSYVNSVPESGRFPALVRNGAGDRLQLLVHTLYIQ